MSGVACGTAKLFDFDEQGVVVTVQADFFNQLDVTGSFPFNSEGLAAAAKIGGFAGGQGGIKGFLVHIGQH